MSERRSLAGSSAVMFAGTLVSRLLGMVRSPLMLGAAIGINYGAANAFSVANKLPNLIYMLIAGGVLNAVLVPQIVRAMKHEVDGGERYVNRLLTLFGLALAGITVVLVLAARLLVGIYGSEMDPEWFDLAVVFAVWTIPQLFFYGLYTVLGQVLNARGNFGPFMWAPALNNVVAIAGLIVYLAIYGGVSPTGGDDASIWTTDRVAVLAGTATLGVAAQALILLWPLRRSGFRFRPELSLRGSGLGRASKVAMWVFGTVIVGQLAHILVVRAGVEAAEQSGGALDVPGPAAYDPAYTLFVLPNSLVVVSLVTALFTRMATNATTGDRPKVRADLSLGLRVVGLFTVFASGALMVLALPVVRVVAATVTYTEVNSIARVTVAMLAGLVGSGALTVIHRVYYAFEDTRRLFWIQLPCTLILAVGALVSMLLPPEWTLVGVGVAMTLYNTVTAATCYLALRHHLPSLDGARVLRSHVRVAVAAVPAVLLGWGLLHLLGVSATELSVPGAVWRILVVGTVMTAVYVLLLSRLRVEELPAVLRAATPVLSPVLRRLPAGVGARLGRLGPAPQPAPTPVRTLGSDGPEDVAGGASRGSGTLNGPEEARGADTGAQVLGGRYRLQERLPTALPGVSRWRAQDLVLDRGVEALVLDPHDPAASSVLDAARRAAMVEDPRLLGVLDVSDGDEDAYLVTAPVSGATLAELTAAGPLPADQARAVVGEAASALETARRRGVHHLSLRPEVVHVTADDQVLVTGLAVDAALLGHADEVDTSDRDTTDLAALLHLALTGQRPDGDAPVVEDVPADLDVLCRGVLGVDPDAPRTPSELIRALTPWEPLDHRRLDHRQLDHGRPEPGTATTGRPGWHRVSRADDDAPAAGDPVRLHAARLAAGAGAGAAVVPARPEPGQARPGGAADHGEQGSEPPSHVEPPLDTAGWALHEPGPIDPTDVPDFDQVLATDAVPPGGAARHTRGSASLASLQALGGGAREGVAVGAGAAGARLARAGRTAQKGYATVTERRRARAEERARRRSQQESEARVPAGEPADPGKPPLTQRRIDPTPVVLVLALLAVVIVAVWAVQGLTAPTEDRTPALSPSPTQEADPAPEESPPEGEEPAEEEPVEPPAPPVVASLAPLDPQGDGQENPDLTSRALDGDPSSYWRSRMYVDPEYGMKNGIGLAVTLEQATAVSEVELNVLGQGGLVQVRATSPADPAGGELLAEAEMGPSTVLTLAEPVTTDVVVLWFPRLPVAQSDGLNRIELAELAVR